MINKKTFLSVAASGLLALFSFSASANVDVTSAEDDTFYAKVFYNGVKVHAQYLILQKMKFSKILV